MSLVIPARVAARAATKYTVVGECWISNYSVASHGYAQIGWSGDDGRGMTTAHRAAWTHYFGQPGEDTIDHLCKTRRCVRPDHLRPLSNLENARRTFGRDWKLGTCVNGHNQRHWRPSGTDRRKGYCELCKADVEEAYRAKRRVAA